MMHKDVIENKPLEPQAPDAPKFILKMTSAAKKKNQKPPTFSRGELIAWKGVWFQLIGITKDETERPVLLLQPQVEEVKLGSKSNETQPELRNKGGLPNLQAAEDLRRPPSFTTEVSDHKAETIPDSSSTREVLSKVS